MRSAAVPESQPAGIVVNRVALVCVGATMMTGHVQAGLSQFGPLSLLPILFYGLSLVLFVLALPGRLHATMGLLTSGLLLAALLPSFLLRADSLYGIDKFSSFLQLALPLTIIIALLVDDFIDVERYWEGVIAFGLFGLLVSLMELASGISLGVRGSINEASLNPISIGRVGGAIALWVGFGGFPFLKKAVRVPLVLSGLVVLVAASSRGPMIGLVVAGVVAALNSSVIRGRLAKFIIVLTVGLSLGFGGSLVSDASERVLEADIGLGAGAAQEESRGVLWVQAYDAILDRPWGVGFAQFGPDGSVGGSSPYPHNILLEIGLEMGIVILVLFCIVWVRAFRGTFSDTDQMLVSRQRAMIVFWTVSALFSSDVNGNRILIGGLVAAFVAQGASILARSADGDDEMIRNTVTHG